MTGEIARETGKPAVQSTSSERKPNLIVLLALILMQLCIKLFWRSLCAAVPQVESDAAQNALAFTGIFLFAIDCSVQAHFMHFMGALQWTGEYQYPDHAQVGCGATLVAAYTLWFLPSATTMLEIFRVGAWVNFVFNIGCLAESRWGFFREGANALSDE